MAALLGLHGAYLLWLSWCRTLNSRFARGPRRCSSPCSIVTLATLLLTILRWYLSGACLSLAFPHSLECSLRFAAALPSWSGHLPPSGLLRLGPLRVSPLAGCWAPVLLPSPLFWLRFRSGPSLGRAFSPARVAVVRLRGFLRHLLLPVVLFFGCTLFLPSG